MKIIRKKSTFKGDEKQVKEPNFIRIVMNILI